MPRRDRDSATRICPRPRCRLKAPLLARSALVGVLLFVGYYLLPLNTTEDIGPLLLIGG